MSDSTLFKIGTFGKVEVKNRLMVAPMTRISASESGVPGDRMAQYYTRFALGEFGTIITEGIYIDNAWSQTYSFQAGLVTTEQIQGWRKITDDVHVNGGKIFAQLMHAGAISQGNIYRDDTVAPSGIQPKGEQLEFYYGKGKYKFPKALKEDEILEIIRHFAEAAEHAVVEAGFDGIEIHGANGYLLDQFFTDYSNQRTDRWGGDITGRLSLTLAVIAAVRESVGADVPVGVRISQGKVNDFNHKWKEGIEGASRVFALLAESGVDFIHITEHDALKSAFDDSPLSLIQIARNAAPGIKIIANGSLGEGERSALAIEQGADFVALGKSALANPDWPQRVRNGSPLQEFDKDILGPVANVKDSELSL
ncbi:NADH:flavin oxidoreductase [Pantoea cypripedii]|uniref:NADH:flavin oxidoreductase n=1 Tax=Pantoea cypripedii TaxID=55209 RepID=UPI002FCC2C5B